jgi:hypothetical protein
MIHMNTIKIGFAKIESTGLAQVVEVATHSAIGLFVTMILASAYHWDFGTYTPVALAVLPTVTTFVVKFFGTYSIPVSAPTEQ